MGRTPSNGGTPFRFTPQEVSQMEAHLTKYEGQVPPRDLLSDLAQRFSDSPERTGKTVVQMKQVWNWFQNRRFALRSKLGESPGSGKPSSSPAAPVTRVDVTPIRNVPSVPHHTAVSSGPQVVANTSDPPLLEYEAKSARDGAWYDVQVFLSIRNVDTRDNAEALIRFTGFGAEEDEWINVLKNVRQRSLPCEASECHIVAPGDLILCFQEGKDQALYFDAHVLDAQRRRHDVRGCRCRFLVRYDHDLSEEIVPLRKICRRPETDHRLQAVNEVPAATPVNDDPPAVKLTSATTLGTTNPNPSTPPVTISAPSPSPVFSAGPSFQTPAPNPPLFSAPALFEPSALSLLGPPPGFHPNSALAPSVTAQPFIFSAQTTVTVPAPISRPVASETPAEQKTAETVIPPQVSVPEQKNPENLVVKLEKVEIETCNPEAISAPELNKVETELNKADDGPETVLTVAAGKTETTEPTENVQE